MIDGFCVYQPCTKRPHRFTINAMLQWFYFQEPGAVCQRYRIFGAWWREESLLYVSKSNGIHTIGGGKGKLLFLNIWLPCPYLFTFILFNICIYRYLYIVAWKSFSPWHRRSKSFGSGCNCIPNVISDLHFRRSAILPSSVKAAFTGNSAYWHIIRYH